MPKKFLAQDFRKQQSPPMSPPHPNTLSSGSSAALLYPLGDDDDDDICPVCESECTCHNRGNPSSASRSLAPIRTSTFTSTSSSPPPPPPPQQMQPLKIKLTVPPNLKFRKNIVAASSSSGVRHPPTQNHTTYASARAEQAPAPTTMPQQVALSILDPSGPKRRGRPSKAVVAAREAAKAALASAHASYGGSLPRPIARKGTRVTVTSTSISKARAQDFAGTKGRAFTKVTKKAKAKRPMAAALSTSYSSEDETQYPTFMSAASSSSLTSSSESPSLESSDASDTSDSEDENLYLSSHDREKTRHKKDASGSDPSQKRRDHASGNRWEIKPRKQSVDPEELGMDADSEVSSGDEDGDDEEDSEDDDEEDEEEDEEGAAEADVEEEGLAEVEEEREVEDMDGKLGVSFGGLPSGWSEDDEESSFDADLFFANLDESSDEGGSPAALRMDSFGSDMEEGSADSFSGDEADALLLMDIDSSVQVRRSNGEFEVGVDLDGLSLGFDGQLLLPSNFGHFALLEGPADDSNETDVDMTICYDESSTDDERFYGEDSGIVLQESDGETTEDELVDANGLPNSKAMALFRWPAPVSTVDPLSTVNPSPASEASQSFSDGSHTLRLALATMSAQRGSSTAIPSEVLSGRMSMDEFEEADQHGESYERDLGHTPGVPVMGQFLAVGDGAKERHAVIDGTGTTIPSPFPRSRAGRSKRRGHRAQDFTGFEFTTDSETRRYESSTPFVSVYAPSSDEFGSQSHAQTSDDPSSTEAIDLDDVLDASFLDSEPTVLDHQAQQEWLAPSTPTAPSPMGLNRWDRIPVGTFRRTRETSLAESTPGSDSGLANLYPAISALLNNDMLGTPKSKGASRKPSRKHSKSGASSTLVISPVLLPVRDGDRTPTGSGHALYNPFQQNQQKPRKELRKEKAMMKRKMVGKHVPSPRHQQQHRHHYPNTKTRGTSSVQRTYSSSHVPHLNL